MDSVSFLEPSEEIVLSPVELEDVDDLRQINHPDVRSWLESVRCPMNRLDEEEFVENISEDDVCLKILYDGEFAGVVSVAGIDRKNGDGELGCWLLPEFQGEGVGSTSCESIIGYVFDEMRLNRVTAHTYATNEAGQASLESIGFVKEGVKREAVFHDGKYIDLLVYGVLSSEWDS